MAHQIPPVNVQQFPCLDDYKVPPSSHPKAAAGDHPLTPGRVTSITAEDDGWELLPLDSAAKVVIRGDQGSTPLPKPANFQNSPLHPNQEPLSSRTSWEQDIERDEQLSPFAKKNPDLTECYFNYCTSITDEGLKAFTESCRKVQKAGLSHFKLGEWMKTEEGVIHFLDQYPGLLAFEFPFSAPNSLVTKASTKCPNLQSVKFQFAQITSEGLKSFLDNHPNITELDLYGSTASTDESVAYIMQNCKKLTKLRLSGNGITDKALREMAAHGSNLKVVKLTECQEITNSALKELFKNCPKLVKLSIQECSSIFHDRAALKKQEDKGVSNEVVETLAANCPDLEEVYIEPSGIAKGGLIALAQKCPNLRDAGFDRCRDLSTADLEQFINEAKKLKELQIPSHLKATRASIQEIAQNYPHLKIIYR